MVAAVPPSPALDDLVRRRRAVPPRDVRVLLAPRPAPACELLSGRAGGPSRSASLEPGRALLGERGQSFLEIRARERPGLDRGHLGSRLVGDPPDEHPPRGRGG